MPQVDATYVIGVIREKEKDLLEDDEYTRLIDAATGEDAVHVLADTVYGKWLGEKVSLRSGLNSLDSHLQDLSAWLKDSLNDERIWKFIATRYDGLNIATALLKYKNGAEQPGPLSKLGSISEANLQSCIWNDIGWETIPDAWTNIIRELKSQEISYDESLSKISVNTKNEMSRLAFTSLMSEIVKMFAEKDKESQDERPITDAEEAAMFERKWDKNLMDVLKKYRLNPVGFDAIVAFWYAKELEVKQLRLMLSAKAAGMTVPELRVEQRGLYRALA